MNRRTLLSAGIGAALPLAKANAQGPIPIIDTHVHLFDPTRPQGVPWPPKTNTLIYKPTYPKQLREVTKSLGVVGAIEVECSPLLEDNQWVLDVMEKDTIMVGTIGDIEAGRPEFKKSLDRFRKNKLFRGIRCGNLWGRDIHADMARAEFISDLKLLADADLTLDLANPTVAMMQDVARINDRVPNLRIVMDHLPKIEVAPDKEKHYRAALGELQKRPKVYVKVSAVLKKVGDRVPSELSVYKPRLDEIFEAFGADRVVYGSDWPNSEPLGRYRQVLAIVREYFNLKGREIAEKYFWKNSVGAYKWVKRDPSQPQLKA